MTWLFVWMNHIGIMLLHQKLPLITLIQCWDLSLQQHLKSTNKNIIYHYGLEEGAGKFLKIPVVMGRTNTAGYSDDDIEEMKLRMESNFMKEENLLFINIALTIN